MVDTGLNYDSIDVSDNSRVLSYDDVAIRQNKELQQFLFLIADFDLDDNVVFYDAFNGMRFVESENKGFEAIDKSTIIEKDSEFTLGEFRELYDRMNENKVNFTM